MRLKIRVSMTVILCFLALLQANNAGAQFLQYTPPGGPAEKPESRKEALEREVERARYHLGPVRVAPWASLHDIAFIRSLLSDGQRPPSDVNATVGAGFRAYLRNGRKVTWTGQVLPEYVWWNQQSERRQLNGRYLLGFYGYFNRLTLEVRAGREQQQQVVTPEVPVPVSVRSEAGEILAELEVSKAIFAFAAASLTQQHNLVQDEPDPRTGELVLLDREERITRGGLRWRPSRRWSVALGAERSEVDFDRGALDRSNSGTSPVAEVSYLGRRLGFQVNAAARSLAARRGSDFVPYDKVTGKAAITLEPAGRLSGSLYASHDLVYSLFSSYAYLDDERVGVSAALGLGRRLQSRFFFERGTDTYTAFEAGTPRRQDDVTSYGASLKVTLTERLSLSLQGLRSEFVADTPGGDRSYTSVGTTINFGGL